MIKLNQQNIVFQICTCYLILLKKYTAILVMTHFKIEILHFLTAGPSPMIVGGSLTTISTYPYLTSLLRSNDLIYYTQYCVGTILTSKSVLTSANCV